MPNNKKSKIIVLIIAILAISSIVSIYIYKKGDNSINEKLLNIITEDTSDKNITINEVYYNKDNNWYYINFDSTGYRNDKVLIKFDSTNKTEDTYYKHIFDNISSTDYAKIIDYGDYTLVEYQIIANSSQDSWVKISK